MSQKPSTKPPSGMRDFLADDILRRRHAVNVIQNAYEAHGFVPLETPTIENLTTLLGKYGDEGDQLLYRILHRRDALARALDADDVTEETLSDLGLRYDLTVPLARVVAQYNVPKFYKRYQIQPVWRADRPAKGRYREFYQCDVDVTGTESLTAEGQVCEAVSDALVALGFDDFMIHLNHRAVLTALIAASGIDLDLESTALVAVDKLDKIGPDGVKKELSERGISQSSAERLLTLIDGGELENAALLDRMREDLGDGAREPLDELAEVLNLLAGSSASSHIKIDPALARGLSYYTGCIFEISVAGAKGSVGGGGRYDNLVGMFSKQQVPAVGFSLGLERLLLLLEERELYPDQTLGPDVYVCWLDLTAAQASGVARKLRTQGLCVDMHPKSQKLGKQIQYADQINARFAAIVGSAELERGVVSMKHLKSGEQTECAVAEVSQFVSQATAQS